MLYVGISWGYGIKERIAFYPVIKSAHDYTNLVQVRNLIKLTQKYRSDVTFDVYVLENYFTGSQVDRIIEAHQGITNLVYSCEHSMPEVRSDMDLSEYRKLAEREANDL